MNFRVRKVSGFPLLHVVAHYVCLLLSWRKNGVSEAWQRQFPRLNAHKCQSSLRLGQGQGNTSEVSSAVGNSKRWKWRSSKVRCAVDRQLPLSKWHPFGCGSRLLRLLQKTSPICPMRLMLVSDFPAMFQFAHDRSHQSSA